MEETTLSLIYQFLKEWNKVRDVKELQSFIKRRDTLAKRTGQGFTFKWYLSEEDFKDIAKELEYDFSDGNTNRIIVEISFGRQVEFEIDTQNILDKKS